MKGCALKRATMTPLAKPMRVPASKASGMAASGGRPSVVMATAMPRPMTRAIMPTDMSMPPASMTKSCPMVTRPRTVDWRSTSIRLEKSRKVGERIEATTTKTTTIA
jgi:hypothetical protein